MNEQTNLESHDEAIRRTLSSRPVMRRDELFLALPLDLDAMENSLNDMIGRGEVETLRPYFAKTRAPCFYRLVRDSDDRYEEQQMRHVISRNKLFDLLDAELA